MKKYKLCFLLAVCLSAGCFPRKEVYPKLGKDEMFTIGRSKESLAQKADSLPTFNAALCGYDTSFLFTSTIHIPAPLINPSSLTQSFRIDTLVFVIAKKDNDLYFWGDQNFNYIISDDSLVVRKNFFKDTAHRWLKQFDKKIDYTFCIKHLTDIRKDIALDVSVDISKTTRMDQSGFVLDVLFKSKPGYKRTIIHAGLKRYVAIVENLPVTKIYGFAQDKVYIKLRNGLKKRNIIDLDKGYYTGDTIRLNHKAWILDYLSYRGDTIVLSKTKYRKKVNGSIAGTYIVPFEAKEARTDSLIRSINLMEKKQTLLLFWGLWCEPCRYQISNYNTLYNMVNKNSTNIVGVMWDKNQNSASIKKEMRDFNIRWPNIISEIGSSDYMELTNIFRIESIPTYIIFDKEGRIIYRGGDLNHVSATLMKKE